VHYLHLARKGRIYLLFVYSKSESTTLTPDQTRQLREVARKIRNEP